MSENSSQFINSKQEESNFRERIISLEMLVTHLQQENETLGTVLLNQQKQLDRLREQMEKLGLRVEQVMLEPEIRNPLWEKPPHY